MQDDLVPSLRINSRLLFPMFFVHFATGFVGSCSHTSIARDVHTSMQLLLHT